MKALFPPVDARKGARRLSAGLACLATVALAGCNLAKEPLTGATSEDPGQSHPIVLAQAPAMLDLYPVGGHIDSVGAGHIQAFVDRYRRLGGGRMIVAAPAGAPYGQAMADVRRDLAAAGLRAVIAMGTYPARANEGYLPIKMTFRALTAQVATPCGRWPSDIVSGSSTEGWNNGPYPNFGCAYQTALAAEVADPRDLAGPREFEGSDSQMRMRAITNVRAGTDPTTLWATKLTAIGTVGN
jgi:pilus assembly protein CpaD